MLTGGGGGGEGVGGQDIDGKSRNSYAIVIADVVGTKYSEITTQIFLFVEFTDYNHQDIAESDVNLVDEIEKTARLSEQDNLPTQQIEVNEVTKQQVLVEYLKVMFLKILLEEQHEKLLSEAAYNNIV